MDSFLTFFEHMPNGQKLAWIIICMAIFWILEGIYPLVRFSYKKWRHARLNLLLLSTTVLINVLFGLATAKIFIWSAKAEFGLLHLLNFPIWIELVLAIMLLDFIAQYVVHVLLHKISFMWRFHMVHHSDTHVDVTTGTRHHPGDYIFRELFALIAIVVSGMPLAFYIFYRILTILFTYMSHANFVLPFWLDRVLSIIFITPNIHKFHHHYARPWTDTNYGNIFSLWDRLFGTFVYDDPKKVTYGLDVLDDGRSNEIPYQLKVPFDRTIKTDY